MESQVDLQIPAKLVPVFATEGIRYRGAHGGRGSAKTRTFALMTAVKAYQAAEANISGVILCAREYMNSLEESSMEEVKQAIRSVPWLDDYFDIGEKYIRTKNRRVSYVFCGLRHNLDSIKSKARILVAWVDEAESVTTCWSKQAKYCWKTKAWFLPVTARWPSQPHQPPTRSYFIHAKKSPLALKLNS